MAGIKFSRGINGWTPSSISSGYFKNFNFINFRRTNEGWVAELRKGLHTPPQISKIIARAKDYDSIKLKAKSYMSKN